MGGIARGISNAVRNVSNIFKPPQPRSTHVTNVHQGSTYDDSALRGQLSTLQAQNKQLQQQAAAFGDWREAQKRASAEAAQQRSDLTSLINQLQSSSNQAIDRLTANQAGLGSQLGTFGSQLGDFRGNLSGLGGQVAGLGGQLSGLGSKLEGQISGLKSSVQGDVSDLQNQLGAQGGQLSKLGAGYEALSDAQKQQINELYALADQGKGVRGVKTSQGLTFTTPRGLGTGGFNRDSLSFGSLNLA